MPDRDKLDTGMSRALGWHDLRPGEPRVLTLLADQLVKRYFDDLERFHERARGAKAQARAERKCRTPLPGSHEAAWAEAVRCRPRRDATIEEVYAQIRQNWRCVPLGMMERVAHRGILLGIDDAEVARAAERLPESSKQWGRFLGVWESAHRRRFLADFRHSTIRLLRGLGLSNPEIAARLRLSARRIQQIAKAQG